MRLKRIALYTLSLWATCAFMQRSCLQYACATPAVVISPRCAAAVFRLVVCHCNICHGQVAVGQCCCGAGATRQGAGAAGRPGNGIIWNWLVYTTPYLTAARDAPHLNRRHLELVLVRQAGAAKGAAGAAGAAQQVGVEPDRKAALKFVCVRVQRVCARGASGVRCRWGRVAGRRQASCMCLCVGSCLTACQRPCSAAAQSWG